MSFRLYAMLSLVMVMMLSACSSTRGLYDAGAAAAGGVVANKLSNGDPLMTGVGAAGGVLVSEVAQTMSAKQSQSQYKEGYQKGRSDAVKQQYWIVQNQQKEPRSMAQPCVSYLTLPAATSTNLDGTITVPTVQTLRIQE